jgi:DNA polymerase-3 subunit epsilon
MRRLGGIRVGPQLRSSGRSWRQERFATIDLELTGLDPKRDRIVSFGVVPIVDGEVRLDRAEYRLVAPEVASRVEAVAVHRLRPIDLADAPSFLAVRSALRRALDGSVPLAWAGFVEAAFLARAIGGRAGTWLRRILDVQLLTIHLDHLEGRDPSPAAAASLADTAARFGVPPEEEHHALSDAFVTGELFLVVATRLERRGIGSVRGLLDVGRGR